MKKGMGLAIALGGISLLGSLYVVTRVDKDAKTVINPQRAEQYKAANELIAMSLNAASEAYVRQHGKVPERPEELVPDFVDTIPKELFSQLSSTVQVYDGLGGWVFSGGFFSINSPQKPTHE